MNLVQSKCNQLHIPLYQYYRQSVFHMGLLNFYKKIQKKQHINLTRLSYDHTIGERSSLIWMMCVTITTCLFVHVVLLTKMARFIYNFYIYNCLIKKAYIT